MTATPDPQTVREIARKYVLADRHLTHDMWPAVLATFGPDGLTKPEYHAYCDAVREAIRTATVTLSWPDEQPTAEQDGDLVAIVAMLDGVEHYRVWLADAFDPDVPAPDPAAAMYRRAHELRAHFADRIAALDARDADGSAS